MEAVEPRVLLAFSANINFQTPTSPTPAGYVADIGKAYRAQNGLTYGWARDNTANTRDRDSANSPDQRYDTHTKFPGSQTWELAVSNGLYSVRLVAGDPTYTDSYFRFNVEGVRAMDARPAAKNYWIERSVSVNVTDGRLTITPAAGAQNDKIAFIHVTQVTSALKPTGKITWIKQTDGLAPISRVESGVVQLGNKLYVMGGFNGTYHSVTRRVDVLDLATRRWSRAADLPNSQTHAGAATDGRYIYWVSGQIGPLYSTNVTTDSWRYDPTTNQWSKFVRVPKARFGGGLAYLNGRLHFFGGDDATRSDAQPDHWTLNLADSNPTWKPAAPLPFPGDHLSHAVLNGKLYVFGGEHDHGKTYAQHDYAFSYDPATNKWTRLADMPTPKSHFEGATVVINNKIYCIAGQIDWELLTGEVSVYDPASDRWSLFSPFPEKRKGTAVGLYNGRLYLSGGDSYNNGQPRNLWVGTIQ